MSHDLEFTVQGGGPASPTQETNGAATSSTSSLQMLQAKLAQSSHPTVMIFHVLFKGLALFLYLFGTWFFSHFVTLMVLLILLLAADFWVVKNVTGRLLVGLRWWNRVDNDTTTWIFEAAEDKVVNQFDRSVFWTVLYGTPLVWAALFILAVVRFHFEWLLVVMIALSLNGANVYGYYKCSSDQKARFQRMMQQGAQQGAMAMMRSSVMNALTGTGGTYT